MTDIHYWTYPTEIFCGKGAVERLAHRCRLAGATYPLLVTDPGLLTLPPMQKVRACLDEAGIRLAVEQRLNLL